MWKTICRRILYRQWGWKTKVTIKHPEKYVLCLAPHTTNWDFVLGQLYAGAEGLTINFLMKKEWFFWPLGIWFRKLGGIPVWRDKKTSMTERLIQTAKESKVFRLCITPEGTRSYNPEWKRGFYHIAYGAGIPILLYGIDFEKKEIVCTKMIVPSGDIEKDLQEIKAYYKDFRGKHPENFGY